MKSLLYYVAKFLGLFRLTRHLFRDRLLILCYRGFELADEAAFMPGLFMRQETFARRLRILADGGYNVLPLADALPRLAAGTLPPNSICLTIDDGFYSVYLKAEPLLRQHIFPATLYISTYYQQQGTPVYRLVVQYMFWKTPHEEIFIEPGQWGLTGHYDLRDPSTKAALVQYLIQYGEDQCDELERQDLCQELGALLGVDYLELVANRRLSLLTTTEVQQLYQAGLDIQLHTRRHKTCGVNKQEVVEEVIESARDLYKILPKTYPHFCYPSGEWLPHHPQLLATLGVASATTCDTGMNTASTNRLALYRVLDSEANSDIRFEAEISGFKELLRILSGRRRVSDARRQLAARPSSESPNGISILPTTLPAREPATEKARTAAATSTTTA